MKIQIDEDVQKVVEFMQKNLPANKLVSVAEWMPQIARLLWLQTPQEPCTQPFVDEAKPDYDPLQSVSTG